MCADEKCYFPNCGRKNITQKFILILFALLILQAKLAANEKVMKLMNLHCKSVHKYVNIRQCQFKALRRGVNEVTVEVMLQLKPINNATVRGVIRKRGVVTGKPLLDYAIDCCTFQRNKRRNVIANLIYQFMGMEKWSNMNHTCPYDHDLLLNKYPFDGWTMGKFFPLSFGHYTLTTYWATYSDVDAIVDVHFQLYDK